MNRTLQGFVRKELTQTLRDPRMRFILFVVPIIQLIIYGVAISTEVKNIRLAAFFEPKDFVMRDIYERAVNGKWFLPAKSRHQDAFEVIRAGEADAVLVAQPGGFTRALGRGDAKLQLLINATNVIKASLAKDLSN